MWRREWGCNVDVKADVGDSDSELVRSVEKYGLEGFGLANLPWDMRTHPPVRKPV